MCRYNYKLIKLLQPKCSDTFPVKRLHLSGNNNNGHFDVYLPISSHNSITVPSVENNKQRARCINRARKFKAYSF